MNLRESLLNAINEAKDNNKRYVLPLTMSNKSYFIEAEIKVVKNAKNKNFGKVRIDLDTAYNPLTDDSSYNDYMSFENAEKLLKKLDFFEVDDKFNQDDIKSLKSIKSKLSKKWLDNYNLWVDYTG